MFDIVVLQALYGLSIPINKYMLFYAAPFFAAGIRLLISGLLLFAYVYRYLNKQTWPKIPVSLYVQAILFGVVIKYLMRNWVLFRMSASHMACLFNCTPFIAAFLEYYLAGRYITLRQLVAICMGFASMLPLVLNAGYDASESRFLFYALPECMLLLAIVAHCYGSIITQRLIKEYDQPISLVHAIRTSVGGLLCVLCAWVYEGLFPVTQVIPFVGLMLILMIISNGVCHYWSLVLLKTRSVTFCAFSDFLCTGFTLLYSTLFLNEAITMHHIFCMCLATASLYCFQLHESKNYALHT